MTSKKIRIMTDSVADLPAELIEKWDIPVIPCSVSYGGQSYLDDGDELDRQHFYQSLPDLDVFPTTAAPSVGLAKKIIQEAAEGYDHLIGIHVPEAFSATINNIRIAAEEALPPERVTIIDSTTLSIGIGHQVLVAAQVAQETGDIQQVINAVDRVRQHQNVYAAFATMEYLKRSGRVNALIANIGSILQIKPIVNAHDSQVDSIKRVRTFKKALAQLEELVRAQTPLDRLVILHIQNEEGAQAFRERVADIAPEYTPIVEVGPTLGTHIGPGSVGAATLSQKWRDAK